MNILLIGHLKVRLGLRSFLHNFSLLLVEAVGGCYDAEVSSSVSQQHTMHNSASSQSLSLDRLKVSKEADNQDVLSESETDGAAGEVFTFEVGEEAALMLEQSGGDETGQASGTPSRSSTRVR